jgi:nucleotide-binding universal stress UspA family protein
LKTILAAVDFSDTTQAVLDNASDLARAFDAPLYLLHVEAPEPDFVGFEPGPQYIRDRTADEITEAHKKMIALRDACKEKGLDAHSLVVQGPIAEKLLVEAVRLNADCIVLGSHGRGALAHMLLGSVSSAVIKRAACPVLIVPTAPKTNPT